MSDTHYVPNPALSASLANALEAAAEADKRDARESPPPSRPPPKPAGRRKKAYKSTENLSRTLGNDGDNVIDATPEETIHIAEPSAGIRSGGEAFSNMPDKLQPETEKRARKSRRHRDAKQNDEGPMMASSSRSRSGWELGGREASIDHEPENGGFMMRKSGKQRGGFVDDADDGDNKAANLENLKKHTTVGNGGTEEAVIMIIPDLDDVQDDEMLTTVAAAPAVKVNRFKTIKELDGDLMASTGQLVEPPTSIGGIDVSLLVSIALVPPDQVIEPDIHWDWEVIFTEVTSDLQPPLTNTDP
ncbi:uncharacterized protein SPPG_01269 [Spizellomyces punctatus DAOM BR117]|uniref:Intraflagellar transport protein 43 n=1 Tax=Spizellomyces punctatus (strain DAOM BR117) TaxID=645134 RepID=A0A0L0HRR8_SPIPD|nr:uncharacterized protein SPPG_01269 [Spizellomyces punctatus DAOM BR117]KND03813.1 hypothetical protein SPPG_01269 [Spizellomyces punctatus DAOM BR117]|eukprot:XP_016611852.1 hypothetical protein SPPG_01269 [Spizellomyces punctatus DAOM BR117]